MPGATSSIFAAGGSGSALQTENPATPHAMAREMHSNFFKASSCFRTTPVFDSAQPWREHILLKAGQASQNKLVPVFQRLQNREELA
jgi:hypothetical protein